MLSGLVPPSLGRRLFKLAQRRLRRHGLSLVAVPPRGDGPPTWDVWDWVHQTTSIRTLIDIGAHDGEYAAYLSQFFNPTAVHVFEPQADLQPKLTALRQRIPHLTIHPLALAEAPGEATFYLNQHDAASSLLRVSDISRRAFAETGSETASTVSVARLDDILPVETLEPDIMIKIDVQGAEDRVIAGGRAVFSAAKIVLVEMSFVPMYDGQPLFEEVHRLLEQHGLRLAGFKNQISGPGSGQPLFAHCLYRRPDCPENGHS
jgi:FkbM family methyltransferase